jgi:hypothetical protein
MLRYLPVGSRVTGVTVPFPVSWCLINTIFALKSSTRPGPSTAPARLRLTSRPSAKSHYPNPEANNAACIESHREGMDLQTNGTALLLTTDYIEVVTEAHCRVRLTVELGRAIRSAHTNLIRATTILSVEHGSDSSAVPRGPGPFLVVPLSPLALILLVAPPKSTIRPNPIHHLKPPSDLLLGRRHLSPRQTSLCPKSPDSCPCLTVPLVPPFSIFSP